ncbi:hypothetical protein CR513_53500, partial [Mucuna pruriens]
MNIRKLGAKRAKDENNYGRYDGSREQHPRPFTFFLKECGTMLGKPSINDGETLKTAVYILNKVPIKLKHDLIGCMKENWIQEQLVVILLAILNTLEAISFMIPLQDPFLKLEMREFEFEKEENIRNIVFELESVNDIDYDEVLPQTPIEQPQQPQEVPLRRSIRERKHVFPNDYIVFPQEHEDDIDLTKDDPIKFCQAMQSSNSQKWIDAIKDEMKSMQDNDIFKTKKDCMGNIERYKAHQVAKDFTQKEGIDYKETFSPVSSKDYFRTIMTLSYVRWMLRLRFSMMILMKQFIWCNLKTLFQMNASRQWYQKFHQVITSFDFETNKVDDCVYHKFSESKYIFLVLYVDDIHASSDTGLLYETKRFLMKNFEMKDLRETSFVLGIQILRDCSQGILRLSQENYINKVLDKFDMKDSKPRDTPIAKGDKFSPKQCPNNDLERNEM